MRSRQSSQGVMMTKTPARPKLANENIFAEWLLGMVPWSEWIKSRSQSFLFEILCSDRTTHFELAFIRPLKTDNSEDTYCFCLNNLKRLTAYHCLFDYFILIEFWRGGIDALIWFLFQHFGRILLLDILSDNSDFPRYTFNKIDSEWLRIVTFAVGLLPLAECWPLEALAFPSRAKSLEVWMLIRLSFRRTKLPCVFSRVG